MPTLNHMQDPLCPECVLNMHSCRGQAHSATCGDPTMPYAMGIGPRPSKGPGLDVEWVLVNEFMPDSSSARTPPHLNCLTETPALHSHEKGYTKYTWVVG